MSLAAVQKDRLIGKPYSAADPAIQSPRRRGRAGRRQRQTERLGGFGIDDQFELGRLLHRQVGRLCALQNAIDEIGGPFHLRCEIDTETGEAARLGKRGVIGDDREVGGQSQRRNLGGVPR